MRWNTETECLTIARDGNKTERFYNCTCVSCLSTFFQIVTGSEDATERPTEGVASEVRKTVHVT